jgi:hypothetical protein
MIRRSAPISRFRYALLYRQCFSHSFFLAAPHSEQYEQQVQQKLLLLFSLFVVTLIFLNFPRCPFYTSTELL